MVIVNTPVLVQAMLGRGQSAMAITLAAFGGGSMLAALLLPRLLERLSDRTVMLSAASVMTIALAALAFSWRGHASPDYWRSEEHTSELQSLMRISYAVL